MSLAHSLDEMINKRYAESDSRLNYAISHSSLLSPDDKRKCSYFVKYLRIHRNLFMHTYAHVVSCCRGRYLHMLEGSANTWKGWDSVEQLVHHISIKEKLLSFFAGCSCNPHRFLLNRPLVIGDDDSDLLCLLLYCVRKRKLYELRNTPGHDLDQVIELLWQFLMKSQESNVARRLRASIYRMARKSAYLPRGLQIPVQTISNERDLVPGANGLVTRAIMDGRDVVIKKVLYRDRDTQRKCLEMFAGEAILWRTLQHKNIVPFLGIVMKGTFDMGLVSPYFRNGNIRNHIARYRRQDWAVLARGLARDLAEGLEYIHCHEPPIIHGDLKGDNVLVDDAGHARLGDFGQSYASDSGKYLDSTRVGLAAYNPVHWMAPELMSSDDRAKATDKTDVYSFGCVLYEMVSGEIPFQGLSFGQVLDRVIRGKRPDRPESIRWESDPLWKVVRSCWEQHPESRPSARYLVSHLS